MTGTTAAAHTSKITIDGVTIDFAHHGRGQPLLWLHGVDGINTAAPWFESLTKNFEVIAPWHPGFGHSEWPSEFRTVADLVYFHMTLVEKLEITGAVLAGSSFGGWLAAEMAVRSAASFSRLVLIDAYGIKVGGREDRDIADLFAIPQEEINRLAYHDPSRFKRDHSATPEADLVGIARSREAFTYFGWRPYMHNPGLLRWLRRIQIPTLVLWGASDGIVKPDYGSQYAKAIPGARFQLIENAGHYPHIEQPQALVEHIVSFAANPRASTTERQVATTS